MVKYRLYGPKHSAVTEGKVYDLTPAGEGFDFLDDVGEERWTLLPNSIHCERFELISEGPMRIEEGKYYRTRDGRKVGPAKLRSAEFGFWDLGENFDVCHEVDGTYVPGREMPDDLVAEWTEGPVRTVQRIIPGTYDGVGINVGPEGELFIEVTPMATRDPERLERAAAVLTALAGALRDGE